MKDEAYFKKRREEYRKYLDEMVTWKHGEYCKRFGHDWKSNIVTLKAKCSVCLEDLQCVRTVGTGNSLTNLLENKTFFNYV